MKKVLIIDDDNNIVKIFKLKLSNAGYEVAYALDGKEGLNLALGIHPDLILLDLAMPVMDGMAVMKALRKDKWGETVPVIILTNYDTNDQILQDVIATKPTYYLIKTDNLPSQVVEKVDELLKVPENNK